MNLETRARDAAERMHASARVDAEDWLRKLHRTHQRRTAGKVVAAAAAVVVGIVVVQAQVGSDRPEAPVAPPSKWVLVSGARIGTDFTSPVGNEWSKPLGELGELGDNVYPYWASVDPATRRFLINAEEATALEVMTPGRAEPLVRVPCDACLGAALGPGPDEITMVSGDWQLWVLGGPQGVYRETVGPAWTPSKGQAGFGNGMAWSPDGEILAEARHEYGADEGTLTVVLRRPDESAEETTIYEYSEAAPPWFDPDENRFGDGPGAFNGWGTPLLARPGVNPVDLQWAPDSTRLAFVTMTTPEGESSDRQVRWQLYAADTATGDVVTIADLGRCAEPVDEDGQYTRVCEAKSPSLAWAPDGETLTVLSDGSLITYDLTGKVLDSEPTDLEGPLVWMKSE